MTGSAEMLEMRFYFGERDRDGDAPLEAAAMAACARHGVTAAALLRAVEGFGAKHRMRTDRTLTLSEDPPLVAVAVGVRDRIEALAEEIRGIAHDGLLTLNRVTTPDSVNGAEDEARVTVWGPRTGSRSPHLRAVDAFHRHGAAAAMVLLGVDGVLDGERRRARFVGANRSVPALTVAFGRRAAVDAALAEVDAAASLVTVEPVETYSRIARGKLHGPPAVRTTLITSEVATSGAHPRYLELIHRLREEGAAGATALRGVWGFRGSDAPHGDRVLALRRDVPILVEAIDAAEPAARWLELARSLAGEDDVVDSQKIQATLTLE